MSEDDEKMYVLKKKNGGTFNLTEEGILPLLNEVLLYLRCMETNFSDDHKAVLDALKDDYEKAKQEDNIQRMLGYQSFVWGLCEVNGNDHPAEGGADDVGE